jgi:hypothetical protein
MYFLTLSLVLKQGGERTRAFIILVTKTFSKGDSIVKKMFKVSNREYTQISMYKNIHFWLGDWIATKGMFVTDYVTGCRDLAVGQYRDYYEEFGNPRALALNKHHQHSIFKKDPFRVTSFAISIGGMKNEDFHERVGHITRILNKFERRMHWKRTTITDFDIIEYFVRRKVKRSLNRSEQIALVEGPKCCTNNPIIFYIYLATFKLLFDEKNYKEFSAAKSFEDLFNRAEEFYGPRFRQYKTASEWPSVITRRRKIFRGFDLDTLYMPVRRGLNVYGVGVHCFIKAQSDLSRFKNKNNKTLLKAAWEFNGG